MKSSLLRENLIPYLETPVLCTAFLETFDSKTEGDVSLIAKYVNLFDYERGKLLTKTDHCWLWINQPAYQTLLKLPEVVEERMTLNDKINFCGRVEPYTRKDGTRDYGIRLKNFFVVTERQQELFRKGNGKQFDRLTAKDKFIKLASFYAYKLRLEHNVCDWRDLAKYSKKDALILVKRQISRLEGWLHPVYGKEYIQREIDEELRPVKEQLGL